MSVTIGTAIVRFESVNAVLSWVHANNYTIEPTRRGIRVVDSNGTTVTEY